MEKIFKNERFLSIFILVSLIFIGIFIFLDKVYAGTVPPGGSCSVDEDCRDECTQAYCGEEVNKCYNAELNPKSEAIFCYLKDYHCPAGTCVLKSEGFAFHKCCTDEKKVDHYQGAVECCGQNIGATSYHVYTECWHTVTTDYFCNPDLLDGSSDCASQHGDDFWTWKEDRGCDSACGAECKDGPDGDALCESKYGKGVPCENCICKTKAPPEEVPPEIICEPCPPGIKKGLVPCGRTCYGEEETPKVCQPCQLCHFFVMIDNILDFVLFTLVPIIAILMLVIGGFLYICALFEFLPGGVELLSQAKRILTSVGVGLLIIYSAYLIIGMFLMIIGLADWTTAFYETWWKEGIFIIPCD